MVPPDKQPAQVRLVTEKTFPEVKAGSSRTGDSGEWKTGIRCTIMSWGWGVGGLGGLGSQFDKQVPGLHEGELRSRSQARILFTTR